MEGGQEVQFKKSIYLCQASQLAQWVKNPPAMQET